MSHFMLHTIGFKVTGFDSVYTVICRFVITDNTRQPRRKKKIQEMA